MTKTTEPVLEPCPFCGSAFKMGQEPHDNGRVGGMFYIYHDYGPFGSAARECPIEVYRHFNSEAEAIAAWNTRTHPTPSPDVAGLVERCDALALQADEFEGKYAIVSEMNATLSAEVERLREALFELQNQDIGRLHDLLNQALLLMRYDDMGLPGSDHWVWALDAIAALGGKK